VVRVAAYDARVPDTNASAAEVLHARLALIERQRRFEWELALAEGHADGVKVARSHAHDLRNLVQVMELGLMVLDRRGVATDGETRELLTELLTTMVRGKAIVAEITGPRPSRERVGRAEIAEVIDATIARVRPALPAAVELVVDSKIDPAARTTCTADELDAVIARAILDAPAVLAGHGRVALTIRTRRIEGAPWLELIRTDDVLAPEGTLALAVIGVVAARVGGEVSVSSTRDDGGELVIALPNA
jgi:hypothetical protein